MKNEVLHLRRRPFVAQCPIMDILLTQNWSFALLQSLAVRSIASGLQ